MVRLILASRSPRRRELLTEAGYQFEVILPSEEVEEETLRPGESAADLALRLARQKAADVVRRIASRFQIPPVCPASEQNSATSDQTTATPGQHSAFTEESAAQRISSDQPPVCLIPSEQSPPRLMPLNQSPGARIPVDQPPACLPSDQAPTGQGTADPLRFDPVSSGPAGQEISTGPIQAIVIGCDTVVECQGQILGKPADRQHARQILETLSGQEHWVYSGLCLWPLPIGQPQCRVAASRLRMDPLRPDQLEEYLQSGQWEGKAGAFGYQDRLGWVHLLEGSPSNVVGLPLELLAQMLSQMLKPPPKS
jgi:MAF protein